MLIQFLSPSWWFAFLGEAWRWHAATVFLGWLVFPLLFPAFRRLPDAGYAVARVLGAFLLTYVNWILCHGMMEFSPASLWTSLALLALGSSVAAVFHADALTSFLRRRWRWALAAEALAFALFLTLLNIRSHCSDINFRPSYHGAEKLANMMLLTSLHRTSHFPAEDAWFAQELPFDGSPIPVQWINYYYGSHLQWATLARFTRYPPEAAFNLALATLFSWIGMGAFGLVLNLTYSLRAAVAAALILVFAGNLEPLDQLRHMKSRHEAFLAAAGEPARRFDFEEFMLAGRFDLWRASRVILRFSDGRGGYDGSTVNEFPYFSFILGDLHAHSGALPLTLALLHCLLALYLLKTGAASTWFETIRGSPWAYLLIGLLCGALFWFNSWEAIPFGLLLLAMFAWDADDWRLRGIRAPIAGAILAVVAMAAGLLVFLGLFTANFASPLAPGPEGASFGSAAWETIKGGPKAMSARLTAFIKPRPWDLASRIEEIALFWGLIWLPLALALARFLQTRANRVRSGQALGLAVSAAVFAGALLALASGGVALPLCLGMALGWGALAWKAGESETRRFAARLAFAGFLIVFVAEGVFVDDAMPGRLERYNTVFKLYYPAWAMLTIAAIVFVWLQDRALGEAGRIGARRALRVGALWLVVLGMLYPGFATWARTDGLFTAGHDAALAPYRARDTQAKRTRTLNGLYHLGDPTDAPADFAAIRWLNANIEGRPHILEAAGPAYSEVGRVSAYTGLPTVIGWDNHQGQWRGWERHQEAIQSRKRDVEDIYVSMDIHRVVYLLLRYNIKYVYVGRLERSHYPHADFDRFEPLGRVAYRHGDTVIWEIDQVSALRFLDREEEGR